MSEPGVNQPEKSVVDRTATEATPGVKSPLNSLEHLPSELLNGILASLPDVKSLVSATSSCRAMYSTFKESESIILSSVLSNSLGVGILPIATMTYKCSPPFYSDNLAPYVLFHTLEQVETLETYISNFVTRLEPPTPSSIKWTMRDAIAVENYHRQVVLKLTEKFIQACRAIPSPCLDIGRSLQASPPSSSEKERIARSLYHFEIFRRLFGYLGKMQDRDLHKCAMTFFSKFAPWENAQLACIHDFLARQIVPAFNDIARHDVVWGEHSIELDTSFDDAMIQDLLASGLERILQIASAKSYREREALLTVFEMPPGVNNVFLMYYFEGIEELDPEEDDALDILEAPAFFPDEDIGAEQIWRMSLNYDPSRDFAIYDALDWTYRECGYVFWDQERLQALGALTPPWKPAERSPQNYSPISLKEVYDSWRERSAIYKRGGRGCWSKGDGTRVVWPYRKNSSADTNIRVPFIPESLPEAKEFWQTFLKLNIS
ncbi:hypothetical protein K445DRAFT_14044 [Daldinia sp. EC12]|nr:hypothetical protein K445DRAFT_14044 [Daldinia sp. EC12]